jgi:hypothetical protein
MYFYNTVFHPYGTGWGGVFAPTAVCEPLPPSPPPCGVVPIQPDPSLPPATPVPCPSFPVEVTPPPGGGPGNGGGPPKTPKP